MVLQVKELGLSAFMQMKGCEIIGYDSIKKIFNIDCKSDKTIDGWSIDYSNSCCASHDRHILTLRNLVRNSKVVN